MKKVRKNIDYVRLRHQVGSQTHVAKFLDVDVRTIQRRESGQTEVSREAHLALTLLANEWRPSPDNVAVVEKIEARRKGR